MSLTFPDTDANSTIPNDPNCDSIYCNSDNQELVDLGQMMKTRETTDDTTMHLFDTAYQTNKGIWNFYDKITNKQITSQPRPYSATTYILMSAGYDGVFGTRDDIYNFE
ncbi:MAG: hypothetical protein A2173_10210 [Planctomycetes bacterium RBG_13_44_8b]|nr:MAG: hypothetical protein A2173_10210 [Planctomycetes bacterium RBG_13_44_8b]